MLDSDLGKSARAELRMPRVDYDAIADRYDENPQRRRGTDAELIKFLQPRSHDNPMRVLDVGCGTGIQLVANRPVVPSAYLVGVDRFLGMLRQAHGKNAAIAWLQADAAALPFQESSFDFISCQFAFHHVEAKERALREIRRVLAPGGRFVMVNICPEAMTDWPFYEYFPQALKLDLDDFWPRTRIADSMERGGFIHVDSKLTHLVANITVRDFLDRARQRYSCSNLLIIDDPDYAAGLARLEREATVSPHRLLRDHTCLVTIRGDRPKANL